MNKMTRRTFSSTTVSGIAALVALSTANTAEGQQMYSDANWTLSEFAHLTRHPAQAKQVYDVSLIADGKFLNSIKNALNGLHYGFRIPNEQIRIIAALHGPANMLNYDDFIWNKFKVGAWLNVMDSSTGEPTLRNPFLAAKAVLPLHSDTEDLNSSTSVYQDTSILTLQHRGVKLLSCHNSAESQARALIAHHNLPLQPEDVVKQMEAHTLPGVLIVPSMVAAIGLLQTSGHYGYIKV